MTMQRSTMTGPQRHVATIRSLEVRAASDDNDTIGFRGHAAVFNQRVWIGPPKWGFLEEIAPGAFAKTITEADIRMLKNHDPNFELARSTIKTGPGALRLSEDKVGLMTDADMIATTYARDLEISLRHGVVSQMSFSFLPVREEWSLDDDENDVRKLIEVKLFDVGPVTFPAYPETDAGLRAAEMDAALADVERDGIQRRRLITAVLTGVTPPDLNPALRAALNAPAGLSSVYAPASATRTGGDPLAARSEHIRRTMGALGIQGAEWAKEAPQP